MKVLYAYLKEVLLGYKYLLGGGSLLLILLGIAEHYTANSIRWEVYIWVLTACFVTALIRHGVAQHKRLTPSATIRHLRERVWPPTAYAGFTGREYYFEIFNLSEAQTLEQVRVELISMQPDVIGYLPVPLHIKHDDYESREFSINPGSGRFIDLVTGPVGGDPRSQQAMIIAHTVNKDRTTIPHGRYKLTVRVSAKDSAPVIAVLEAWISEDGNLKCILL